MKKMILVALALAIPAATINAGPKDDLKQAADVARLLVPQNPGESAPLDLLLNPLYNSKPGLKIVVKVGANSIITANALSDTADTFVGTTKSAITDLQNAAKAVKTASDKVKVATTNQAQIDALMEYLQAQGQFIDVIATYMANLNTKIFNPVFSLFEAMPYVGDKMAISGKPVSVVVKNMLEALKLRNDVFIKAVKLLPEAIKAAEAQAVAQAAPAAGAAAAAAASKPVVTADEFGF